MDDSDDPESAPIGRAHLKDPARARRILVVEDDGDSRDALCALLECWGHHVISAASGQEALGFVVEMRLDAIVFNYSLTDMAGGDFARTLRGVPLVPPPRLVTYSSLPMGAEPAVDVFIQKPDARELERLFGPPILSRESELRRSGGRSR